jgi:AcrR family transcriptional regulator
MREKTRADNERDTPVERDWIAAAREMLIEGGISAVQISPLAGRLGVTRGGFYWRFKNRQDLLDQLLLDWENSNARHFLNRLAEAGTPRERMDRLIDLWMEERQFDPRLEAAIRQWALIDEPVRKRLRTSYCRLASTLFRQRRGLASLISTKSVTTHSISARVRRKDLPCDLITPACCSVTTSIGPSIVSS